MEAKELRLRNYVTIFGIGGTIAQIVPNDFVKWVDDEWECNYLYPIPLTEEWLVKFGFFINETDDWFKTGNEGDVIYRYKLEDLYVSFGSDPSLCIVDYGAIKYFKYVHQLQNLFYALTGEELTLK